MKRVHKWHLSNEQAFELINQLRDDKRILIGHISAANNSLLLIEKLRALRDKIVVVPAGMASPVITG